MPPIAPLSLPAIIEKAYDLFAPYTIGRTLDVCKACCVTDAEEQELVQTPLRAVSRDLLQNAYYESARSYSARELWEMKHFLPRVLELVSGGEFPCHSLEITFSRLDLHTADWLPAERALLHDFARVFFGQCLHHRPAAPAHGIPLSDVLVMFGLGGFALPDLLAAWAAARSPASARHLSDLLLHEIRFSARGPLRLRNPFSTPPIDEAVAGWLAAARQPLAQQLETPILAATDLDEDALNELSWAYDVLQTC